MLLLSSGAKTRPLAFLRLTFVEPSRSILDDPLHWLARAEEARTNAEPTYGPYG